MWRCGSKTKEEHVSAAHDVGTDDANETNETDWLSADGRSVPQLVRGGERSGENEPLGGARRGSEFLSGGRCEVWGGCPSKEGPRTRTQFGQGTVDGNRGES